MTRLRRASIATAAGFAVSLTVMSLGATILPHEPPRQHAYFAFVDFWYGLGGLLGSLTFLLFLAVSLASIVPHLRSRGVPNEQRMDVLIVCPRCRLGQTIRSDGDVCRRCRLRISVLTS
jgi:hypothetical protein